MITKCLEERFKKEKLLHRYLIEKTTTHTSESIKIIVLRPLHVNHIVKTYTSISFFINLVNDWYSSSENSLGS